MRTIVAGYDESEEAEQALSTAADIAERFSARLVVVHVGQDPRLFAPELVPEAVDPLYPALPGPYPPGAAAPMPPEEDERAKHALERARGLLEPRGVQADYVTTVGDPAEALLRTADEEDADLVVVGSREHGFLERLLGLGVGETLARKSDRDVLLVRASGAGGQ